MTDDGAALARRIQIRATVGMTSANMVGAGLVFVLLRWVLPVPELGPDVTRANVLAFAAFVALSFPVGTLWSLHRFRPVARWLAEGRAPTPAEQRLALRAPLRQVTIHATLWTAGGIAFVVLNLSYSSLLALDVGLTVALGAASTCAVAALLLDRIDRPVVARALAHGLPDRLEVPGVRTRLLLVWALCSGVPAVGLVALGASQVLGVTSASGDRIAVSALVLGGIALLVGLIAAVLSARSVAEPVEEVRRALDRVRRGETDVELEVYDGSEVGLLQAGFNQMVAGLRERERLRDLFGRQVGADVARAALERGTELGGEAREVGVLFVDLVGSTRLAARRPPHAVVELLNDFFDVVVSVVARHGGFVNKFEGDAALCVFGAPLDREDSPGDALAAARELRRRLAEELPHCDLGIGVSWGTAVAGNIGAAERFEYTVIGDPVNEAARLTELAKQRPERILASGAAVSAARPEESAHWVVEDAAVLRGRGEPTELAVPVAVEARRGTAAPSRQGG